MKLLSNAIILATQWHNGQVDKAGKPYILHPLRVMLKVNFIEIKIVAVLHDILEDTECTYQNLKEIGLSNELIEAIYCLTRQKNEDYMDFIKRCKQNPIARIVKLADLEDNCDLSRIENPTEKDYERVKKYKKATNELLYG